MRLHARHTALALLTALALAGLSACDQERVAKLEEGVASESDVRQQFGEPTRTVERADGSKVLEYPRQPEGTTNYVIEIGPDGKMSSLRQLLQPANFAKVQPGMSDLEVRQLLGQPAKTHRFDLKPDETIWDWRFQDGQERKVFSVTFGKDKTVIATATQDDPRERDAGR
ncbi:outer membrane protein assembly factor BamE domain-containing protein [Ideonella paludis]|uniref:Outer membrane protein assembly factor BamE n=1 Tax=Ideonella paludis TaxID=1233411 RepID=A0ABS5DS11_9BURK|nr:outer membrane protein assembly factor BamE [Ideonella paludis]MBQ0933931.1 outer membrane protein assembly factor BamE [Ideonella paludis]